MRLCSTAVFGAGLGAWHAPGAAEAHVARFFVGCAGRRGCSARAGLWWRERHGLAAQGACWHRRCQVECVYLKLILDRRYLVGECVRTADASEPGPEIEIAETSAETWCDPSRSAFPRKPWGYGRWRAMDNRTRRAWAGAMRASGAVDHSPWRGAGQPGAAGGPEGTARLSTPPHSPCCFQNPEFFLVLYQNPEPGTDR